MIYRHSMPCGIEVRIKKSGVYVSDVAMEIQDQEEIVGLKIC